MRQEVKTNKERIRGTLFPFAAPTYRRLIPRPVLDRNIKKVLGDRPTIEKAITEAKEEIEFRRK